MFAVYFMVITIMFAYSMCSDNPPLKSRQSLEQHVVYQSAYWLHHLVTGSNGDCL